MKPLEKQFSEELEGVYMCSKVLKWEQRAAELVSPYHMPGNAVHPKQRLTCSISQGGHPWALIYKRGDSGFK